MSCEELLQQMLDELKKISADIKALKQTIAGGS
jgi:hypothetical protein